MRLLARPRAVERVVPRAPQARVGLPAHQRRSGALAVGVTWWGQILRIRCLLTASIEEPQWATGAPKTRLYGVSFLMLLRSPLHAFTARATGGQVKGGEERW